MPKRRRRTRTHPAEMHVSTQARGVRMRATTSDLLGLRVPERELVIRVRAGLPFSSIEALARRTRFTAEELCRASGIASRTYSRRRARGVFAPEQSDRVARVARVMASAQRLFEGDEAGAKQWFERQAPALGGVTPLSLLDTDAGVRRVEELIGQLEHGLPS